jgi:hypothetical protein
VLEGESGANRNRGFIRGTKEGMQIAPKLSRKSLKSSTFKVLPKKEKESY